MLKILFHKDFYKVVEISTYGSCKHRITDTSMHACNNTMVLFKVRMERVQPIQGVQMCECLVQLKYVASCCFIDHYSCCGVYSL